MNSRATGAVVSNHWRKGGVAVTVREDRSVHIYAPEPDRVLSPALVDGLMEFLVRNGYCVPVAVLHGSFVTDDQGGQVVGLPPVVVAESETPNLTVPSGEVTTSRQRGRPRKAR